MKLRTTVGALLEAFELVTPTLDRKGSASNLYLQASEKAQFLYLYSTNLISETATKLKAEVETNGEALINPSKLKDGLAGLPKPTPVSLTLAPTGNVLKVQAGNVKFSLACSVDVKDLATKMHAIPSKLEPTSIVPVEELIEFTKRAVFCIPNDQTGQRQNLTALKISDTPEREEAFATDGAIAVHVSSAKRQGKGSGLGNSGLLIPSSALQPLSSLVARKKGESVAIIRPPQGNKTFFKFADGTHLGVLTMPIAYPNLTPILNQEMEYYFDVNRESFKQSLGRASSFVPSASTKQILGLDISGQAIQVLANGDDILSDEVPVEYTGKKPASPVRLGININYLTNIVASSHSDKLTFGFSNSEKPIIVLDKVGEEDEVINIKYVVAGVRI